MDRDRVAEQLRTSLQNMAAAGLTITYAGLPRLLELSGIDAAALLGDARSMKQRF